MEPETRYAKTADGVHIAYQVHGQGPIDLVYIFGFATCFEIELEERRSRAFFDRLSTFSRLILFDKRGTGLSDRPLTVATLEQRSDDIRAVMEAAGSERAVLLGISEGGSMACFFSATYPEKTRSLIVWGARTDRRWTVLVGALLALPATWYGSLSMLIGLFAIDRMQPPKEADDRAETTVAEPAGA